MPPLAPFLPTPRRCAGCGRSLTQTTRSCSACGQAWLATTVPERLRQLDATQAQLEAWTAIGSLEHASGDRLALEVAEQICSLEHLHGLYTPPGVLAPDEPVTPATTVAQPPVQPATRAPAPPAGPLSVGAASSTPAWLRVAASLLAERTLDTLLGLGVALLLASGIVISVFNPTGLSPLSHLGAMVVTTLAFFGVGVYVRQGLRLTRPAAALLAVGAAFFPLDAWTLGLPELLNWPTSTTWLAASLLSLPLYAGLHRLLRDRPFGVLTGVAEHSVLAAALHAAGAPVEAIFTATVTLAAITRGVLPRTHLPAVTRQTLGWVSEAALGLGLVASVPGALASGTSAAYACVAFGLGAFAHAVLGAQDARGRRAYVAAWLSPFAAFALGGALALPTADRALLLLVPAAGALVLHSLTRTPVRLSQPTVQLALALPALVVLGELPEAPGAQALGLLAAATTWAAAGGVYRRNLFWGLAGAALPLAILRVMIGGVLPSGTPLVEDAGLVLILALVPLYLWVASRGLSSGASYRAALQHPLVVEALALTLLVNVSMTPLTGAWARVAMLTLPAVGLTYFAQLTGRRGWLALALACGLGAFGALLASAELAAALVPLAWVLLAATLLAGTERSLHAAGDGAACLSAVLAGTGLRALSAPTLTWAAWFALIPAYIGVLDQTHGLFGSLLAPWQVILAAGIAPVLLIGQAVARRAASPLYAVAVLVLLPAALVVSAVFDALSLPLGPTPVAVLLLVASGLSLGVGALLDGRGTYGRPFALLGYALLVGVHVEAQDTLVQAALDGGALLLVAASAIRHHLRGAPFLPYGAATFHSLLAILLPFWSLELASALSPGGHPAGAGVVLAIVGLGEACLGRLLLRRVDVAYEQPWGVVALALSVLGPVIAWSLPMARAEALTATLVLYTGMVVVWRSGRWLFAALPVGLAVLLAWVTALRPATLGVELSALLAPLGWVLLLAAVRTELDADSLGELCRRKWSAAPVLVGLLASTLAVIGSLSDPGLSVATAGGLCLLLGTLATWRLGRTAANLATVALVVAAEATLRVAELPLEQRPAWLALLGLLLVLAPDALTSWSRSRMWTQPAERLGAVLACLGTAGALLAYLDVRTSLAQNLLAVAIAASGAAFLAVARRTASPAGAYLGIGLLDLAGLLLLSAQGVTELQAFALPAGGYLLGVAFLEARRRDPMGIERWAEIAGLCMLLVPSVLQACGWMPGLDDHGAAFLLVEAIALVLTGAALRRKRPFFAGTTAVLLDVAFILADPIRAVNTWYLMALIGVLLIGCVIFLERQRERLPAWLSTARGMLESWG